MLAKLLSLLIHAKAGAISGVFLLGATGALVSVSASNGVTTITLTDPSPSPTASASPRPSGSPKLSSSAPNLLSSPKPADACTDETKAITLQVQRVDSAFKTFHTDLMKLRGQRDRATIEKADAMLKLVRHSAVKAIHATATCKKHDDDEDETAEHSAATGTATLNTDREQDEDNDSDKDKEHGKDKTLITFTGDAASIATQAITAMQTAFDTAKNAAATTPKPSHSPEQKKHDDKKHDGKSSEHHD